MDVEARIVVTHRWALILPHEPRTRRARAEELEAHDEPLAWERVATSVAFDPEHQHLGVQLPAVRVATEVPRRPLADGLDRRLEILTAGRHPVLRPTGQADPLLDEAVGLQPAKAIRE